MRTLDRRLTRLERPSRHPDAADRDTAELMTRLLQIEASVLASGDFADRPDAPPVERAVRCWMRGDATIPDALADALAGRWSVRGARH